MFSPSPPLEVPKETSLEGLLTSLPSSLLLGTTQLVQLLPCLLPKVNTVSAGTPTFLGIRFGNPFTCHQISKSCNIKKSPQCGGENLLSRDAQSIRDKDKCASADPLLHSSGDSLVTWFIRRGETGDACCLRQVVKHSWKGQGFGCFFTRCWQRRQRYC